MTLQQEVYEKIMKLPEDSIRLILVMADEIAGQKEISLKEIGAEKGKETNTVSDCEDTLTQKQKVFQKMLEMREKDEFPKDFAYKEVVGEAVNEKYGFTN